jgi:CubicO group peptidase (beta-lactamase class C family)
MTVRDLLRHTSGLIYPELDFAYPERGLADATADFGIRAIHRLYGWADATAYRRDTTLADFVSVLARLPLAHQPGEVWEYGLSADVLGRVIEVASGEPLDRFLQSRIFTPLHMLDTGFYVPEEKLGRLVDSPMPERPRIWNVTKPPKLFSGGGGLVSTAPDYLRFCQMLLNDGELDGVRLLTPQAVKEMTTNALPPDIRIFGNEVGPLAGRSFGLGFAIRADPVSSWTPGAVGSFSWAGLWGTYFWIDPAEKLVGLQMIQAAPGKGREAVPFAGINHLAYGALMIAEPSSFAPPAVPTILKPDALADYVGSYDFGASVSSHDRQGLTDGKTGWLGIEAFVAMEQEGLRINRPYPRGPATKAGVTAGDLITELDDAPLKGLSLADVLAKLRGPANSTIRMKIVHKGQDSASDLHVVRAARRVNAVHFRFASARQARRGSSGALGRSSNSRKARRRRSWRHQATNSPSTRRSHPDCLRQGCGRQSLRAHPESRALGAESGDDRAGVKIAYPPPMQLCSNGHFCLPYVKMVQRKFRYTSPLRPFAQISN